MKTKANTKGRAAKLDVAKKDAKPATSRGKRAKTGEEIEHYLDEAKKINATMDKKYVAIKKKVRDAAKDLQCRAEDIRDQAAKKIEEWLE